MIVSRGFDITRKGYEVVGRDLETLTEEDSRLSAFRLGPLPLTAHQHDHCRGTIAASCGGRDAMTGFAV